MNKQKAGFFDRQADAPWSDAEYTPEELDKIEQLFSRLSLAPGLRALEPGCGTGRVTRLLAERVGPEGTVIALDISANMIEKCRARTRGLKNVTALHAALEDLELEPESFDLVLCFNVFPHLDDQPAAVKRFQRLLVPGGRLAIFHLQPSSFINDLHRKAGTTVEKDLIPGEPELRAMLEAAGFTPLAFEDTDRFFVLAVKNGPDEARS